METVQVQIGEQTYTLRCEDPERVQRLAHRFDEMMRQMKQRQDRVSTLVVTVLAALNLLEEYDVRCEQMALQIKLYEQEIEKMTGFLQQRLADATAEGG